MGLTTTVSIGLIALMGTLYAVESYGYGGYGGYGGYNGYHDGWQQSPYHGGLRHRYPNDDGWWRTGPRGRHRDSHSGSFKYGKRHHDSSNYLDICHRYTDEIYRFQIGENYGPYEFIDKDGIRRGFHVDLLKAVCTEAGKCCKWLLDKYSNCWDTDHVSEYPGQGLLGNWYEACIGLYPHPTRRNSFNFSLPFTNNFQMVAHYRQGKIEGDPKDMTGRKIGFVHGWAMSVECFARQTALKGSQIGEYTSVMFQSDTELLVALQNGEIDTFFSMTEYVPESYGFQIVEPGFYCTDSGTAVMARYSRQDVLDWWNEAFTRIQDSGEFKRLCERAQREYGEHGTVHCV